MISEVASPPFPHNLQRRAVALNQGIYASLPWGYRIAELLTVLGSDSLDSFGRTAYAAMISGAVRRMPPSLTGKAASDYLQEVLRRGPDALPSGYGRPFAARVFKILLAKFSDPEVAEEAMSHVMLQFARGKLRLVHGSDLRGAESYVITVAINAARDILRSRGRRREDPLVRDHENEQSTIDIEDPRAFERLDNLLPVSELRGVLRDLERVHPRAPAWLRARLDGDDGQEIAREWGTTPSYISKWQRTYVPEIKRVVEYHLRQAASRNKRQATPETTTLHVYRS